MSSFAPAPPKRSRWLDWKPEAPISGDSPESEPTKPSEPGSVGFEGAPPVKPPEICAEAVATRVENAISWAERRARPDHGGNDAARGDKPSTRSRFAALHS